MSRRKVLAIVLAGGAGGRMDVLTRERAKPSLPFAGVFQLIDFPLSNLKHSGVAEVWLSIQYQPSSLDAEVANGRPWDLDRTYGGFRLLVPQEGIGTDEDGLAKGNADVLYRVRDQIRAAEPEILLVMSADHIYAFDYEDAINRHDEKGAECTVVTTEVDLDEAVHHATVTANRQGRVTDFDYKPERPSTGVIATEVFVYDPAVLLTVVEELQSELTEHADDDATGLGDFGEHLLPRLVERGGVYEHRMHGYWKDVGRPDTYFAAHRDLIDGNIFVLGGNDWPILTRTPQGPPARVHATATVDNSLLSAGCEVHGVVRRSVLGPGVVVEAGATVSDSVLFARVRVEGGAQVSCSILDTCVVVGAEAVLGGQPARAGPTGAGPTADELVLVGRDCVIAAGATIGPGGRLEPGTT